MASAVANLKKIFGGPPKGTQNSLKLHNIDWPVQTHVDPLKLAAPGGCRIFWGQASIILALSICRTKFSSGVWGEAPEANEFYAYLVQIMWSS